MKQAPVTIVNQRGLHARASAKLANAANIFDCDITLMNKQKSADCKSIMQIMMLAASYGSEFTLKAEGIDEEQAIMDIKGLISRGFDELD